jgi:hypothetical protein
MEPERSSRFTSQSLVPILSKMNPVHTPHSIHLPSLLILSSHLFLDLPSCIITSGFPTKTLYAFPFYPICATCPVHFIRVLFFMWHLSTHFLVMAFPVLGASRTHSFRHTPRDRTPLDEYPARRRDLYLTTNNTHNRQTSMPPARFEPTIPESEWPKTHALDRAATGIGYPCTWAGNIKMDLTDTGWATTDCIHLPCTRDQ